MFRSITVRISTLRSPAARYLKPCLLRAAIGVAAPASLAAGGCSSLALDPPNRNLTSDGGLHAPDASALASSSETTTGATQSDEARNPDGGPASTTPAEEHAPTSELSPATSEVLVSSHEATSPSGTRSADSPDLTVAPPTSATADSSEAAPSTATGAPGDSTDTATDPEPSLSTDPVTLGSSTQPPTTSEPPACQPIVASPSVGVHVSVTGTDAGECGASNMPCRTISFGQSRAATLGLDAVYVAAGTYAEALELTAPITLIGGWVEDVGLWTRPCAALASTTVVNSTQAIGLRAEFTGSAQVQSFTINSKGRDSNVGESRYGVFATGAGTHLELRDVAVRAASANHGSNGSSGGTLPAAGCEAGSGENGASAAATPTTPAGSFAPNGYVPGDGFDGANGNPGQGGSDGAEVRYQCTFCSMVNNQCQGVAGGERTAAGGQHGCGGGYGTGGAGASGGGASVGVFAWLANVEFGDEVVVVSGDGGNGATGGGGGNGATGTAGTAGEEVECNPGLNCGDPMCGYEFDGQPGTKGGDGSAGAGGGGGAGGWSVTLVGTAGAFSGSDSASTLFGDEGASTGSGPAGTAKRDHELE